MSQGILFDDRGLMEKPNGLLYLFGENPNTGRYKIGKTTRKASSRLSDLSTGNPGLYVVASWNLPDYEKEEEFIHGWLSPWRVGTVNGAREWFWIEKALPEMHHMITGDTNYNSWHHAHWFSALADAVFPDVLPDGWRRLFWDYRHGKPCCTLAVDEFGRRWSRKPLSDLLRKDDGSPYFAHRSWVMV